MDASDPDGKAASKYVTSTESWTRRGRITWTYVGIAILVCGGLFLVHIVLSSIFTFIIGGTMAFLLRPVVSLLMRWKLSRGLAVLVTSLLLIGLIIGGLAFLLPQVAAEVQAIAADLAVTAQNLKADVADSADQLPASSQASFAAAQEQFAAKAATAAKGLVASLAAALGNVVSIGFDLFLGYIVAIWFMLDGAKVARWSLSVLPPAWRTDAAEVGHAFDYAFGGFIRGAAISMALMFTGMAIGFNLIGVPYATALAALCGVLAIVPVAGGIVGGIVATLVALTVSPQLALMTLVVVLIVEQTVDSVIEPIVMGEAVRLHPLAILFSLAIGGALAGIAGMIVAVPAAAVINTLYLYFARKFGVLEPAAPVAAADAA